MEQTVHCIIITKVIYLITDWDIDTFLNIVGILVDGILKSIIKVKTLLAIYVNHKLK